jgi:hypothetical protein
MTSYKAEKSQLISVVTANKRNIFTKDQLELKDLNELKALAQLATDEKKPETTTANYAGQGDPGKQVGSGVEALPLPVMNFDKK